MWEKKEEGEIVYATVSWQFAVVQKGSGKQESHTCMHTCSDTQTCVSKITISNTRSHPLRPSTADKYTHKTHTCTTVAECELWSQMLAHVFKANDIQWARYWENTSFHTKSFGSFILWLWGLKMGLSPDGPECSRMDLGPCFCLQWLVALHCKFSDTVFAKGRHNIWLFLSVCMETSILCRFRWRHWCITI